MSLLHGLRLGVGLATLAFGAFLVLARGRITSYHETRDGRAAQSSAAWATLGAVLLLVGVAQIAAAVI